ncbi:MAG: DUF7344 domain-containing protein [archaeon]
MVAESKTSPFTDGDQPEITESQTANGEGETCDTDVEKTDADLSLNEAFDIVKNERRRLVLKYLVENEGPVALGDLAEHIAAIENDKDVVAINSSERKRVYVGLYQCHLPKMDAADVIESERNSNITLGENADQVMQYVDVGDTEDRPWNRYYLSLSLLGAVAVLADAGLGLGSVGTVFVGLIIVGLLATAIAHTSSAA